MRLEDDRQIRIQTACLLVLVAVSITFSVYWLRPVLVPLVVAFFVVSGISPVLSVLEKRLGVTRIVAAGLTFLAGVIVLIIFGCSIWVSMIDLSTNAQAYRNRVSTIVNRVESYLPQRLSFRDSITPVASGAPTPTEPSEQAAATTSGGKSSTPASSQTPRSGTGDSETTSDTGEVATEKTKLGEATAAIKNPTETDAGLAGTAKKQKAKPRSEKASKFVDQMVTYGITTLSQAFVSLVSTSVVVLIYVFFLLIGTPSISHSPTLSEVDQQIRSYLSLKTVISIFTGVVFGLALRMFGVPMAFTFGVLAFLLNFVPNVGPIVASLLPIPLIILDPEGSVGWMAATITVICTIQLISGNVVEPKIMGNSSDLHPVTILVGLMFWGMMWGIIGMFLATPIMAALKIILGRIEGTKSIADLMAGRWTFDLSKQQVDHASQPPG
ncbi:AI-2E family transporter [Pseudomonadales bacterium]|jgi:AI-2 transport protein TqsA|nr:AI-2E family transporter [Pseudomonadales bacterium]